MSKTNADFIKEISEATRYVALVGEYELTASEGTGFFSGGAFWKSVAVISTKNKIIDGSAASVTLTVDAAAQSRVTLFNITKSARNLTLRNMNIEIKHIGGAMVTHICAVRNNSYGLTVRDCNIGFTSSSPMNYTAVYNDGDSDTHLETPADSLRVVGCRLTASVNSASVGAPTTVCGIDNVLANSCAISENYIFVKTCGESAEAIGMRNSGRFLRCENNNIKANGSHSSGRELKQARVWGVYNTGLYLIFTGNNCVGEWAGACVGLFTSGGYANVTGNKILATHTVMGRSVIVAAEHSIVSNNVLTNTSRNPHFLEIRASNNIAGGNIMRGLMETAGNISGCGILVIGEKHSKIKGCRIYENIIIRTCDIGIALINTEENVVRDNNTVSTADLNFSCGGYLSVYAENSADVIEGNGPRGKTSVNEGRYGEVFSKNLDAAVRSLE